MTNSPEMKSHSEDLSPSSMDIVDSPINQNTNSLAQSQKKEEPEQIKRVKEKSHKPMQNKKTNPKSLKPSVKRLKQKSQ